MSTSATIILTYDRLHCLKECIESIRNQTRKPDAIFVVDNGSKVETKTWLQQQKDIITIALNQNIGPAAGMKTGLQEICNRGFEWIWCMDDDGCPHPRAFERLMETKPELICAKNSLVLDIMDKHTLAFKMQHYKTLDDIQEPIIYGEIMPWNGTLFHRNIFQELGFPIAELFLWGEENEFYYRIKRSGLFKLLTVTNSYHYHPRNAGLFYKKTWNVTTDWRAYYFIRNKYTVYLTKWRQNFFLATLQYILFAAGMSYYILFYQPQQKYKKFMLLKLSIQDGFKKEYGKTIENVKHLLNEL